MAVPTSRTKEKGAIHIHSESCTGCGRCVKVCKDFSLKMDNGKAALADTSLFGCVACGHCMAVCPAGAIEIIGRTLSPDDLFILPSKKSAADYNSLSALMHRRRSVREFTDEKLSKDQAEFILSAVRSAPAGLPPTDVHVLTIHGINKNREFAEDFADHLKNIVTL